MLRRIGSALFLIVSLSIALGAFGHASQWPKHVAGALTGVKPEMGELLRYVWYWVSGAMFTLGLLLIGCWWQLRRGPRNLYGIPALVGAFYFAEGIAGLLMVGPFFLLFTVQALLLWTATAMLARPARDWPGSSRAFRPDPAP